MDSVLEKKIYVDIILHDCFTTYVVCRSLCECDHKKSAVQHHNLFIYYAKKPVTAQRVSSKTSTCQQYIFLSSCYGQLVSVFKIRSRPKGEEEKILSPVRILLFLPVWTLLRLNKTRRTGMTACWTWHEIQDKRIQYCTHIHLSSILLPGVFYVACIFKLDFLLLFLLCSFYVHISTLWTHRENKMNEWLSQSITHRREKEKIFSFLF